MLAVLVAFRQAEAGGRIKFNYATHEAMYPTKPLCTECPFTVRCNKGSSILEQITLLEILPEFALTIDELQTQYPELFV